MVVDDILESQKKSMSLEKDIAKTEILLLEIKYLNMMDDLEIDAKLGRTLNRHNKNDEIDDTMLSNSKIYNKFLNAKQKLKILMASQTPTKVAVDINASVASNLTGNTMTDSSIPSVIKVNMPNNSPIHRRCINFDNYLDNQ